SVVLAPWHHAVYSNANAGTLMTAAIKEDHPMPVPLKAKTRTCVSLRSDQREALRSLARETGAPSASSSAGRPTPTSSPTSPATYGGPLVPVPPRPLHGRHPRPLAPDRPGKEAPMPLEGWFWLVVNVTLMAALIRQFCLLRKEMTIPDGWPDGVS